MKKRADRNLVQKHALQFNKSQTFRDRKKDKKKGYMKHKNNLRNGGCFVSGVMIFLHFILRIEVFTYDQTTSVHSSFCDGCND